MTKKYLLDPFSALYQENILLSDQPEIQELNKYAIGLEEQRQEELDLQYLTSEFAYNQLAFVRNGLLLAKIKFLRLYKDSGDGTFASFCRDQLRKQRWQINDTIRAARVVLELMYAGFDILPTNISQAISLAKLAGEQLIEKWRMVIENIPLDKITAKSIRNVIKPPEKKDNTFKTILVPKDIHENIERGAAARDLSIIEFLEAMVKFFINGATNSILQGEVFAPNLGVNSHLLQSEINTSDYTGRQPIWQKDLAKSSPQTSSFS